MDVCHLVTRQSQMVFCSFSTSVKKFETVKVSNLFTECCFIMSAIYWLCL